MFVGKKEIFQPATVNKHTVYKGKSITLDDFHDMAENLALSVNVPDNIRKLYEISRNLFVYSFFVPEFAVVAYHQSFLCIEAALKAKVEKEQIFIKDKEDNIIKNPGLKRLMRHAKNHGWIKNIKVAKGKNFDSWINVMVDVRNSISHGEYMLFPPVSLVGTIEICKNILEDLFSNNV